MSSRTVTAIEPYPKGKGYAVYINDEFAFVLYKGELSKYHLSAGDDIDDEQYERISAALTLRAKKRGMNLLKTTDRTEADVRRRLSDGRYPAEAVDAAIEYLRSYHYLDDMRYSCEFIRFKSSRFGRKMITAKLAEKGVSKSVIEAAFAKYDEESASTVEQREEELISSLINKRYPEGISELDYAGRQKLYAFLYRKGFSPSAIDNVCSKL